MRKSIIVTFVIFVLMLVMTSNALASSKDKSGTSTGGQISSADVTAKLYYSHDSVTYSASASTSSTKTGECKAIITIYFNSTYDRSSKLVQDGRSATTSTVNSQSYAATHAISQHSYKSYNYGSWSCNLSQDF